MQFASIALKRFLQVEVTGFNAKENAKSGVTLNVLESNIIPLISSVKFVSLIRLNVGDKVIADL
jgi:hypothetical protein